MKKKSALRQRLEKAAAGDATAFTGSDSKSLDVREEHYECGQFVLALVRRSRGAEEAHIALPSELLPMLP